MSICIRITPIQDHHLIAIKPGQNVKIGTIMDALKQFMIWLSWNQRHDWRVNPATVVGIDAAQSMWAFRMTGKNVVFRSDEAIADGPHFVALIVSIVDRISTSILKENAWLFGQAFMTKCQLEIERFQSPPDEAPSASS